VYSYREGGREGGREECGVTHDNISKHLVVSFGFWFFSLIFGGGGR